MKSSSVTLCLCGYSTGVRLNWRAEEKLTRGRHTQICAISGEGSLARDPVHPSPFSGAKIDAPIAVLLGWNRVRVVGAAEARETYHAAREGKVII